MRRKILKTIYKTCTTKITTSTEIDQTTLKNEEIYNEKITTIKNSYKNLLSQISAEDKKFFEIGYSALNSLTKVEKEYFFYRLLIEGEKKEETNLSKIKKNIKKSFFSIRTNFLEKLGGLGNSSSGENVKIEEKEVVEEKTIFDVELTSFDAGKKLMVIKNLKSILGLGLKETKEFVEKAPQILKEGLKKEDAEELSEKLMKIGCVISIK